MNGRGGTEQLEVRMLAAIEKSTNAAHCGRRRSKVALATSDPHLQALPGI